ncbi:phosphatidylinositol-binding protein scs2 [Oleoguttula sp. CCFEE 5521]
MSVDLEPSELGFRRPFNNEVSQVLRLHNPNKEAVVFKVKTTAPKQYCVRPNSGRIEPLKDVEVQVLLQAMKEDPPPDARCRDKFLVQSVGIPAEQEATNTAQIWHSIETTAKSSIQEKKIRVTFLPADGGHATNGGSSVHDDDHGAPPAYSNSSPSPVAVTPQRSAGQVGGISTIDQFRPEGARSLDLNNKESAYASPPSSTQPAQSALSTVTNAIPTSSSDLQAQLDAAKAQISRLQEQATEGLRQRNIIKKDETPGEALAQKMQSVPAGGVSVPITAGLCLLCFLVAYFFF